MDFHSLKRKDLQALCKKHGIPANLTNREMADRLASNFKENEDPVSSEELSTSPVVICSENEAKVVKKQSKKVRFSPETENQAFEYEVSVYQKPKRARRQTLSKNPAQVLENAPKSEDIKKLEGCQLRVRRSRVQNAAEEDMNTVSSPSFGRKRGRGGKESKDAKEVEDIGDSESYGKIDTGGRLSGRQLRSRKNVTQGDAKKIRNVKGGDEFHLLGECSEVKDGPKQQSYSNVEVVSRVTRQSRAQSEDVASMVNNEVGIKKGYEADKPVKRSKGYSGKDCAKSATSAKTETRVTKAQEQSERDIALVEPPECLRRYPSRQKSVVSQSGKGANEEERLKEETKKGSRTTELDAVVEDSSEVEWAKNDVTSQHKAPSRRGRRKTVIVTAPASELENKKDIAVTSQHQAPTRRSRRKTVFLTAPASELANQEDIGKGTTEEPRKSGRNTSRYSLSGASKQDPIAVTENDQRVKHQAQEPIWEEEETSARPPTLKPQRRSSRNTSISASVAPPTELNAVVDDSGEVERTNNDVTSQHKAPSRRGRRKTVIVTAPASELANKKDIAVTSQHQAPLRRGRRKTVFLTAPASELANQEDIGKGTTEEPRKSGRNASRYSLSGTSKQDPTVVTENDQRVKHQAQEPILEEEETSARPPTQKPQRRSSRNTSISASVAPPTPTAKGVEKEQQNKSTMEIVEDKSAAPTESLPSPRELPDEKDVLVTVSERAGNGKGLDLDVSEQVVKSGDTCSNKSKKGLRRNSVAKKQYGCAEASPLFLNMEKCQDSAENMEETLTASHMKLVGPFTDQETKQPVHESAAIYYKERNLVEDDKAKLVNGGDIESEVNCMSSQTVNTSVFDSVNLQVSKSLKCESKGSYRVDSSQITFPTESHGNEVSDQEMKEDMKLMDTHSTLESLIVYKEDITLVESEKEMLVQVDGGDNEMDHHSSSWSLSRRGAVSNSNRVKSRQVEFESNVINMDEITSRANDHFDQIDLTGATSTFLQSEEELGTELSGGENTNLASENLTAADRTPFAEAQIAVELKDIVITAAESVKEEVLNLNKFGETSGFKGESEITLTKAEEIIATDVSNKEGISQIESSVEAAENQESSAKSHFVKQQCSYSNTVSPGTPCEPARGNQFKDKCRAEVAGTARRKMFDRERIEDPNPGNAPCSHESVLMYEEKDEEIRIHDDYFESESSPSLNRRGPVDDSNLVSPGIVSLADIFCSASQVDHAGKSSSHMELEKVLETQEPSGNLKTISYNMDVEGIRTSVTEDQERSEDPDPGNAPCIHESVFMYEENTTRLVKNNDEIRMHDDYFEGQFSPSLNRTDVVSPEIVSLVDIFSSASQREHAGKTPSRMELEKVSETQEPSENMKSIIYNMDAEGIKTPVQEDQKKGKLENANVTIAESVEEVIFNDLLDELGESICLKRGSKIPFKTSEKLSATKFSDGEGIKLSESSVKAEMQEYRTKIDVAAITSTPNTTKRKCILSSDMATQGTPVGLAEQCQDKLCSPGIAVSITGSEICNQDMEISLVEDEKEKLLQDDTIKGEMKSQHFLSNKTGSLDDAWVEVKSNPNKIISSGMTCLADVFSPANQTNFSGTSNVLKPEELLDIEESSWTENVNYRRCKIEVKEDKSLAQEDLSSMHLEDTNITVAEPVQEIVTLYPLEVCQSGDTKESEISLRKAKETGTDGSSRIGMVQTKSSIETNEISGVKEDTGLAQEEQSSMQLEDTNITHSQLVQEVVFSDHLNKVCVSGGTKEFEVSLKKAELTGTDDSFGKEMVQTESSVGNNEMNEATGQKAIMAMEWSQDFLGTIYRVETDVSNAGYSMAGQLINEENVKIVENEERINTEKEFYLSRKKENIDQSSEGKFVANGVFDPVSENNSQCAKDKRLDFSDGSFNNVSGETQEKPCEVLDGEGTDHVSPEENGICNDKLPYSSCLPAIDDTQEKSEAVRMDIKNTRIEIPVNILPQLALEQLDTESETQEQGAESGEVKAGAFTHAFPPENLTAPFTSESFSMSPLDHAPMDGETNASGEIVMDHPLSKDFVATMDGNGIIVGGETDGVEEDNIVEEIASTLKLDRGGKVDAELYGTDMSDTKTIEKEHPQAMDDINDVVSTEISTECKEHKHLDESTFFTKMEMSLFWGDEDEVKETDTKAGDSNDVDNAITECNSSEFKDGDYVATTEAEDTIFSVKRSGPEDTEETVELREDFSGQDSAMGDKSPLLKSAEVDRVVDGEAAPAFRTELNLINVSAKKETSNSLSVKQLTSSTMKSKSNSGFFQKTPKRQIFHDMKENEGGSTKRAKIGNKTTPKTLSKLRLPLERI